jgi:hypothetical protein
MKSETVTILVIAIVAAAFFWILYQKQAVSSAQQSLQLQAQQQALLHPIQTAANQSIAGILASAPSLLGSWLSGSGSSPSGSPAGLAAPSIPTNSQTLVGPQPVSGSLTPVSQSDLNLYDNYALANDNSYDPSSTYEGIDLGNTGDGQAFIAA